MLFGELSSWHVHHHLHTRSTEIAIYSTLSFCTYLRTLNSGNELSTLLESSLRTLRTLRTLNTHVETTYAIALRIEIAICTVFLVVLTYLGFPPAPSTLRNSLSLPIYPDWFAVSSYRVCRYGPWPIGSLCPLSWTRVLF